MKNCDTCGHCILQDSENSPGGVMHITNYKCENSDSSHNGQVMNIISGPHGSPMDAREKESCDNWEDHQTAAEKRKKIPTVVSGEGKSMGKKGLKKIAKKFDEGATVHVIRDNKVTINGEEITIPHRVKKGSPESITILNDNIYINGYRYKNGLFYRNIFTRLTCWL